MIKPIIEGTQTVVVNASDLAILLGSTTPFAAHPEAGLPDIAAVQLRAGNDVLTATATNRYCLGYARKPVKTSGATTFLFGVEDAKHLLKRIAETMKHREFGSFPIVVSIDDRERRTMTVDFEPYSFTFKETGSGNAPDLASVLANNQVDPIAPGGALPIGVNAQALRPFVKASKWAELQPMRWTQNTPEKPVVVELGDWFIGLIMPVRVPDDFKAAVLVDPAAAGQPASADAAPVVSA